MSEPATITNTLAFMRALEARDLEGAQAFLHPAFRFSGWTPEPLDRTGFLELFSTIFANARNLRLHFNGYIADQDYVKGIIQVQAQQLSTGKSVLLPREAILLHFQQGKIRNWYVHEVPGGGLKGLLEQVQPTSKAAS